MNNNPTVQNIPSSSTVFAALVRADTIVQWRQRRSVVMSVIVPVIFLISWKGLIPVIGAEGVLATCIAIGLPAMGLMGYSISLARDRERGIFQRLRATPTPTWAIMLSRIVVQCLMIFVMTLLTYTVAYFVDGIHIGFVPTILMFIASLLGGLSFLAIGQALVAYVIGSEAVNSAARLLYFPLAIVGSLGQIGIFGAVVEKIVTWSPLGTTRTILVAAMLPSTINAHVLYSLLVTVAYSVVFAAIGIRWFRWSVA
jgi:ABC-2 type transport system permease protein